MGKANRERRRRTEKARRQRAAAAAFRGADDGSEWFRRASGPTTEEMVAAAVRDALDGVDRGDDGAVTAALAILTSDKERPASAGHRGRVERSMAQMLVPMVTGAWESGWQPADLVRLALRRRGPVHSALVSRAIGVELSSYATATIDPRWLAQLDELEIGI